MGRQTLTFYVQPSDGGWHTLTALVARGRYAVVVTAERWQIEEIQRKIYGKLTLCF